MPEETSVNDANDTPRSIPIRPLGSAHDDVEPLEPKPAKVRATLYLPPDLLDEARDAVFHLAGYPARMTLTKLAEQAFRRELQQLKDTYHDGQDFPRRTEDLKGGRPIAA